jgi:hypothetical protein
MAIEDKIVRELITQNNTTYELYDDADCFQSRNGQRINIGRAYYVSKDILRGYIV